MRFQELFETQQLEARRTPSLSQRVFLARQAVKRAKLYRQVARLETANDIFSFGIQKVTDQHLRERWTTIFYELLRELEPASPREDQPGPGEDQPGPGEDQAGPGEDPQGPDAGPAVAVRRERPARESFPQPLSCKRRHIDIESD